MKKLLVCILCVCIFTACFSGCSQEEEIVLNVFNWGEYISDGEDEWTYVDEETGEEITIPYLDINSAFEEYYFEKYGKRVRVNYTTYASNEEMYAKLLTSDASFDIIIPSEYIIPLLIKQNLIQPINVDNIPNYKNIGEKYVLDGVSYVEHDGNKTFYSATYTFGKVAIIYNLTRLEELFEDFDQEAFEAEGWNVLWNEKYAQAGILQFNNSRDAFASAQFMLAHQAGVSASEYINASVTDSKDKFDAAFNLLAAQKPVIQKYVMDEVFNKMESGNACIAPYYVGDYFTMYANSEDELCCFFPEQGSNSFCDAMCVPTTSRHPEIAEEYINFLLSTDEDPTKSIAEINSEYICYATPNKAVQDSKYYQYYVANEMHPDAFEMLYSENSFDFKNEGFVSLDDETQRYLNTLWDSLKIQQDETDIVLPAICLTLAGALTVWFVFLAIRKKRRARFYD